jgi:hypothetical protein
MTSKKTLFTTTYNKRLKKSSLISLSIGSSNCCAGQENAQKGHGRIPFGEGNTPYVRQVVAAPYFKRLLEVVKRHNVSVIFREQIALCMKSCHMNFLVFGYVSFPR